MINIVITIFFWEFITFMVFDWWRSIEEAYSWSWNCSVLSVSCRLFSKIVLHYDFAVKLGCWDIACRILWYLLYIWLFMSLVVIYTTVIVLFSDEATSWQLPNGVLSPVIDVSFAVHAMNPIRVCRSMENVPLNELRLERERDRWFNKNTTSQPKGWIA